MASIDYVIFAVYMLCVLGVGYYFHRRNEDAEDYFVGGRSISPGHVGLSVAATDVGGGFSIGLGGLGYAIGLSGSWLLFTGLVGAWLSAVFIIPIIKKVDAHHGMMTYPDFLRARYGNRVALVAAVISGLGYLGFTSGQILAGAKLLSGSIIDGAPLGLDVMTFSILLIGVVIVGYTVLGGLKAVIYTDTVQWIVLMAGLLGLAIPMALVRVGGVSGLREALPAGHLTLTNVDAITVVNWFVTIMPIWVVGMTLYQRMFASRNVRDAQKAWFIAGLFEYPVMAFSGVALGMMSRVLFPAIDGELGVPMLLSTVLPAGAAGIVVASYFSAIMSTADSCLIASSGNLVGDVIQRSPLAVTDTRRHIRVSQIVTLVVGVAAVVIASRFTMVLDAILQAYSFLVAGLFVPTLGAYFWSRSSSSGAFWAMLAGGSTTLVLLVRGGGTPWGLDASFWGIVVSALVFVPVSLLQAPADEGGSGPFPHREVTVTDRVERLGDALVQHGPEGDRVYVMKLPGAEAVSVLHGAEALAARRGYGKVIAKCPALAVPALERQGFVVEAQVPRLYGPAIDGAFVGKFMDPKRAREDNAERVGAVLEAARTRATSPFSDAEADSDVAVAEAGPDDAQAIAACYAEVFESYPFPIHDPGHIRAAMDEGTRFFTVRSDGRVAAAASMEDGGAPQAVEMTDFATPPAYRGQGLARHLLAYMDRCAAEAGVRVAFTIARAVSYGMNITFSRCGYRFAGTLVNNTPIAGSLESMNVWYRHPEVPDDVSHAIERA